MRERRWSKGVINWLHDMYVNEVTVRSNLVKRSSYILIWAFFRVSCCSAIIDDDYASSSHPYSTSTTSTHISDQQSQRCLERSLCFRNLTCLLVEVDALPLALRVAVPMLQHVYIWCRPSRLNSST